MTTKQESRQVVDEKVKEIIGNYTTNGVLDIKQLKSVIADLTGELRKRISQTSQYNKPQQIPNRTQSRNNQQQQNNNQPQQQNQHPQNVAQPQQNQTNVHQVMNINTGIPISAATQADLDKIVYLANLLNAGTVNINFENGATAAGTQLTPAQNQQAQQMAQQQVYGIQTQLKNANQGREL